MVAWGVAAAGALQLADIVVHNMDLPAWTLRALIWLAALGLPVVAAVSWFYDLTRHGLVRTQAPPSSPRTPRMETPRTSPPAAGAAEIRQGTLLAGRYRVDGELGKGGMGRVLAALDERIGRRVAVKVVTGAHDPARVARFEQEARTAGALEHPNVLAVYDLGEHEGVPFLVTELLHGHTLRTLIDRGALSGAQAHDLALQLARGLAAAHARGIVHRDLKPENLFVTDDGRLKILDFGLARLVEDAQGPGLTQTGAIFGTPGYLSPEQARGEKVGPASDVFSAGAVVYEMLAGRRAFPGSSLIEAGHAALTAEPQALPITVPPALEGVVTRALQKDPSKRFADGGELVKALEPLHGPVTSLPARRSTRTMVALAVLAVAIAFASGLRVSRSSHKEKQRTALVPPPPPAIPGLPEPAELERQVRGALRHRPGWKGLMAGVKALEQTKQPARAEDLLRKQRDPLAHLELYLLQHRAGHDDLARSELRAWVKSSELDEDWPAPLVRAYLGEISDKDALAAAEKDDEPDEVCEAKHYLGALRNDAKLLKEAATPPCDFDQSR